KRDAGAHQHGWPDDGVEAGNGLADDVQVGRPPPLELRPIASEANRRRIVDERIEPDVRDTRRIERKRNSPGLPRPAYRNVFETAFHKPQNLVSPDLRLQELGGRGEVIEDWLLILREAEEVVLFLNPLRRRQVQRALAVDEILLLLEPFASDALPTLVQTVVNVAGVVDATGQVGHAGSMSRFGRADEVVERNIQLPPGVAKLAFHPVAVGQRRQALV